MIKIPGSKRRKIPARIFVNLRIVEDETREFPYLKKFNVWGLIDIDDISDLVS